eukprot:scaffold3363_cov122-Isochrysis_galbana.AAC.2
MPARRPDPSLLLVVPCLCCRCSFGVCAMQRLRGCATGGGAPNGADGLCSTGSQRRAPACLCAGRRRAMRR